VHTLNYGDTRLRQSRYRIRKMGPPLGVIENRSPSIMKFLRACPNIDFSFHFYPNLRTSPPINVPSGGFLFGHYLKLNEELVSVDRPFLGWLKRKHFQFFIEYIFFQNTSLLPTSTLKLWGSGRETPYQPASKTPLQELKSFKIKKGKNKYSYIFEYV